MIFPWCWWRFQPELKKGTTALAHKHTLTTMLPHPFSKYSPMTLQACREMERKQIGGWQRANTKGDAHPSTSTRKEPSGQRPSEHVHSAQRPKPVRSQCDLCCKHGSASWQRYGSSMVSSGQVQQLHPQLISDHSPTWTCSISTCFELE